MVLTGQTGWMATMGNLNMTIFCVLQPIVSWQNSSVVALLKIAKNQEDSLNVAEKRRFHIYPIFIEQK